MKLNKRTEDLLQHFHTEVHNYASRQAFGNSSLNQQMLEDMRASKQKLRDHICKLEERLRVATRKARRK